MALDIDWECYFTPHYTANPLGSKNWYRPWQLANALITSSDDTTPEQYQYVKGQTWTDRSEDLITYADINHTLRFGSTARLILETTSEKDIFEVVDNTTNLAQRVITGATKANPCVITSVGHPFFNNDKVKIENVEGMTELNGRLFTITYINGSSYSLNGEDSTAYNTYTSGGIATRSDAGKMLPRFSYPYRVHRINFRGKNDEAMPTDMFVGHLVGVNVQTGSDVNDDFKDGLWRIVLDFVSFDHPRGLLGRNRGAALWHHRANATTDAYHLAFKSTDNLSFDSAITQIVAWMNTSRPTTDFPVTFSYTPVGSLPYTKSLGSSPISITGTVTMTNGSASVTSPDSSGAFTTQLQVGQKIKMTAHAESTWAFIASITDDNNLTLLNAYTGATLSSTAHKINVADVVTVDGRSTWEVLEKLLAYMGAIEGDGKRYIPQCSNTGVITVIEGGYDKTADVNEDFRSTYGAQDETSFTPNIDFDLVYVPFTVVNNAEYWIQFVLYESDGASGWNVIKTIPNTGYEYVPYDANNTHGGKYYKVPLQKAGGTYKWDATMITPGSHAIYTLGGQVYSPATYQFLQSPIQTDFSKVNSFIVSRGGCYDGYGGYSDTVAVGGAPEGCKDGGLSANGGNEKCTDLGAWSACYPDPVTGIAEAVDPIFGVQGKYVRLNTLSEIGTYDTVCRLHSKKIFECSHDSDSSIRNPMTATILFNEGHTTRLTGGYLEVYSPELNDVVKLRCLKQMHKLVNHRLTTTMEAFRV